MGPSVCSGDGTSEGFMKKMVNGTNEKIGRMYIGFVDVRDTALAHLKAVQVAEAANKRFILCVKDAWVREVAAILAPYNEKGLKVPTVEADGEDPDPGNDCDNTRSREVLGIEYTPLAKTMTDMVDSLIAAGKITPST
jgi:nucleoside-diphosphate-sugar epimerase